MIVARASENQTRIVSGFSAGQSTTVIKHAVKKAMAWLTGMFRWKSRICSNATSWFVASIVGVDCRVKELFLSLKQQTPAPPFHLEIDRLFVRLRRLHARVEPAEFSLLPSWHEET